MATPKSSFYFQQRDLNNDTTGSLKGSVLLAQATIMVPKTSTVPGERQPHLVGLRDMLVLFRPMLVIPPAIRLAIGSFSIDMAPPDQLPPPAGKGSDPEFDRIVYGEQFWSAVVPGRYVTPAMILTFHAGNLSGVHATYTVGAPSELLLNTIDIGMLTKYRLAMEHFNEERQKEYFQTIPCSRLIVNHYEPVHIEYVELANGARYEEHSTEKGTWHEGDLRQRIGKELISLGINNASLGIHSSPGSGEDGLNKHFVVAQFTAHSSIGNYVNGVVPHGYSGGGSIVTLDNNNGNEFSHELGHNFGLGHDPDGFAGSVQRESRSPNSAWGWDSRRNVFIPNFRPHATGEATCQDGTCEPPFHGHQFGRDTMSGGEPLYPRTNEYTLLISSSLERVQHFLEEKAVFSPTSSTGYLRWNATTGTMVEWADLYRAEPGDLGVVAMTYLLSNYQRVEVNQYDDHWAGEVHLPPAGLVSKGKGVRIVHQATWDAVVHVNNERIVMKKGDVLNFEVDGTWQRVEGFSVNVAGKPDQVGVPVTTLVGFYDPLRVRKGIVYPALHCAYGMTYASASATEWGKARCYLRVSNAKGEDLYFILHGSPLNVTELNRFHVNVPQAFQPTIARVICQQVQNAVGNIDPPKGTARVTFTGRD